MKQKISEGTEVFIAGGVNEKLAEENFSGPIVRYKISDFDYMAAIAKGFQEGRRPAIVTYRTGISEKLKDYLNTQKKLILNIVYGDTQDLEEAIIKAEADVVNGLRIIAATNRNLEHAEPGDFRRDLLYRLNVLELKLPPLQERKVGLMVLLDLAGRGLRVF